MDLPSIDHLLTTTHSVRKRLDLEQPVEPSVIQACLQLAIHAPTGSNRQSYHFVVVTDPDKRAAIAGYYRQSWTDYIAVQDQEVAAAGVEGKRLEAIQRVRGSAQYLADNMHRVPVLIRGDSLSRASLQAAHQDSQSMSARERARSPSKN